MQNIDKYPDLRWLSHIGHGGLKDKITAGNMKAEGLKPGIPDYLLLVRRGNYAALWIELKRPAKDGKSKGRVSADQEEWLKQAQGKTDIWLRFVLVGNMQLVF